KLIVDGVDLANSEIPQDANIGTFVTKVSALRDTGVSVTKFFDGNQNDLIVKTSDYYVMAVPFEVNSENMVFISGIKKSTLYWEMFNRIFINVGLLILFASIALPLFFMIKNINKRLEIEVAEKTEDLNKAIVAKQHFFANMSHELRTPLNAILGLSKKLEKEAKEEGVKKLSGQIYHSGQFLLSFIEDIFTMVKIENSSNQEKIKVIYVKEFIETIESAYSSLERPEIHFSVMIHGELPEFVKGYEKKLFQIVTNLLNNAFKFTKEGQISLMISYDGVIKFEVIDTGKGISKENISKIFDKFFREDNNSSGAGIGLFLIYDHLKSMNGNIFVDSVEGKGSAFRVHIPLKKIDLIHYDFSKFYENWLSQIPVVDQSDFLEILKYAVEDIIKTFPVFKSAIEKRDKDKILGVTHGLRGVGLSAQIDVLVEITRKIDEQTKIESIDIEIVEYYFTVLHELIESIPYRDLMTSVIKNSSEYKEKRILIVDDKQVNLNVLKMHLRSYPFEIVEITSALEALNALEKEKFDFIFMDIFMPEMNGTEVVKRVREWGVKTTIIAVTADVTENISQQLMADGQFDGYISKPVREIDIIQIISKYLNL
ncbi:MAG: hybrid sensor histidine kinase/response regulator, partial [Fusobacteria bacterium]|nr:hybrid sensor histidine kinase/response regulator [Fusobacteriota bacterium]